MAFNPMDMFQAGGELGKANISPFNYGASNIMDRFNAVNDAGMKMALQAQLFKGEHNWDFQNDPGKIQADYQNRQMGVGPNAAPGGQPAGDSVSGGTTTPGGEGPSGAVISQNGGGMMVKDVKKGIYSIGNPDYNAAEQKVKDTLSANQRFNSALSMIRNMYEPMAGMHKQIGGGGFLPGLVGESAKGMGSVPDTDYIDRFDTASKDLAANTASQWSGNKGGVSRLVDFFNSGGMPTSQKQEQNNLSILQQQAVNNYSLAKAHSNSQYAAQDFHSLDENQIKDITGIAKDPALITQDEQNAIKKMVADEYGQVKQKTNAQQNPLTAAISGAGSKIPYSGFHRQMNPLEIAVERKKAGDAIRQGAPGKKVAERFNRETGEDL